MRAARTRTRIALVAVTISLLVAAVGSAVLARAPAGSADGVPALRLERVLRDFDMPLQVAAATHRRQLYVVEQSGRIRVARRASATAPWQRAGVFLDLRAKVAGPFVGRGLLGLAFHPAFAENGLFYVFYTRKHPTTQQNGDILIAEYRADTPLRADPASARTVMVIAHPSSFHFGGWMGFGPDGYLYISTGDAANVAFGFPQDLGSRLGKILRIDPTDPEGDADFSVPTDNPFVGEPGDDAIWAYGFRNPWRASFDRETGALWVADVGQGRFEEVNRASPSTESRGANYGWSLCEGSHRYDSEPDPPPCTDPALTLPIIEYAHDVPGRDDRCSVIGGHVYRGTAHPSFDGRYFFGDYCTGEIWSVPADHEDGEAIGPPLDTTQLITSFGEDARGEIYVTGQRGSVFRIVER